MRKGGCKEIDLRHCMVGNLDHHEWHVIFLKHRILPIAWWIASITMNGIYMVFMYFSACGIAAVVSQFQRRSFTNQEVYQVRINCKKECTRNGTKTWMLFSVLVLCFV